MFGKGKTTAQDRLCQLAGTEGAAAGGEALRKLYRDKDDYVRRVEQRLKELDRQGWFLPEYVDSVLADARAAVVR